jgi:RNA polymerase sigma factor (sigma-70 family)
MSSDADLLHSYLERNDERAFGELVRRHLGLVYSAALRRTGGRTHLAEEVSQKVFSGVARSAAALIRHPTLTGWLYRATRNAAIDAVRAEHRRQKLAQSLNAMPDTESRAEPQIDWEDLRPVIDEAMDQLKERDREVVLLRYFGGLTFAEVGFRLNLTENAARMRTERGLDQLRVHLCKRGVTSTTVALGLLLANSPLAAAPVGLAATVSTAAFATAPTSGAAGLVNVLLMSKLTAPVISAAIAAGLTALVYTSIAKGVAPQELAVLRQEHARLTQATAASASAGAIAAVADEFAAQANAIVHAVGRKHAVRANGSAAAITAVPARTTSGAPRHRDHGQATSHDAVMSFAWATDSGEISAISKLLWFDGNGREKALAILASMPESIRSQYATPEEFYAFLFAVQALLAPPPGADVLDHYGAIEVRPGRASLVRPGQSPEPYHQYQQTADGWKFVIYEPVVDIMPQLLNAETCERLSKP